MGDRLADVRYHRGMEVTDTPIATPLPPGKGRRESSATEFALALLEEDGMTVSGAAQRAGISHSTLTRAMRRRKLPPRTVPKGEAHWNWQGGKGTSSTDPA